MDGARTLRDIRAAARLSQRELARRAGVPQSTVARIETGKLVPRIDTFDRLVHAAGHEVVARPRAGFGVDRSQMRELLRLTPDERLRVAVESANNLTRLVAATKPIRPS